MKLKSNGKTNMGRTLLLVGFASSNPKVSTPIFIFITLQTAELSQAALEPEQTRGTRVWMLQTSEKQWIATCM